MKISKATNRRLSGFCALAISIACTACSADPTPPHIVLVTFDTLRLDHVGAYTEGESPTPEFDAVAAGALVHEAAFTTIPTTSPAHTSLFTGLHPFEHGVKQNGMTLSPELAATRSLPERLRGAGYTTGAFVTSRVFGPEPMGLAGFDRSDSPRKPARSGNDAIDAAIAWLDDTRDKPVFLWVHLFDAHSPYGSRAEKQAAYPVDHSSYGWVERSRYAEPDARDQMNAKYRRGVRDADAAFGRLVSAARSRLEPDPILIATADHGEFLDDLLDSHGFAYAHGSILDEAVLRIPLFISGPNVEPGRSSGAVSIRDLYTTILEAAGVGDPDASREGRRDLRIPSSERRLIAAERRRFRATDRNRKGIGPEEFQQIRKNAVAVTDGIELLVVGEDGAVRGTDGTTSAELHAAAQAHLAGHVGRPSLRDEPVIDAETERALEALGYVH